MAPPDHCCLSFREPLLCTYYVPGIYSTWQSQDCGQQDKCSPVFMELPGDEKDMLIN